MAKKTKTKKEVNSKPVRAMTDGQILNALICGIGHNVRGAKEALGLFNRGPGWKVSVQVGGLGVPSAEIKGAIETVMASAK